MYMKCIFFKKRRKSTLEPLRSRKLLVSLPPPTRTFLGETASVFQGLYV